MNQVPTTDTHPPSLTTFVDYRRTVHEVFTDLRILKKHADTVGLPALASQIEQVVTRLESERFSVAVVGEFKRGKSTFINALLGADILPTDVLPCSATLNRVTYGLEKRAVLEYRDGHREEIPFDRLTDHVTKLTSESEEIAKSIRHATVHFPSPYCQNNVDVIDTPGLNDDDSMTEVTLEVLPTVDAAIMVIRAQSPFGEYERKFLETRLLSADLGRVLFVVNGIDQLNSPRDVERVIEGIERRIQLNVLDRAKRQFGESSPEYEHYVRKLGRPRVFGLSAYEAVKGKAGNDVAALERSRFPQFEKELQRFLTEQRGAITLEVPVSRTLTTCSELLSVLTTQSAALKLEAEAFERAVADSQNEIQGLRGKRGEQLRALAAAGARLEEQVGVLADSFVRDFQNAVLGTIDSIDISSADISGKDARKIFDKQMSGAIEQASAAVVDAYSLKLQGTIEATLIREAERMQDFDGAIRGLMGRIAGRFSGISEADTGTSAGGETAAALVATFTGFGGIWGGYRKAGWKGAGVGAATSVGVLMAGGLAASLIGVTVSFPVIVVLGVASFFSGGWVSDKLFGSSRIANYRQKLREEALLRLEQEMSAPVVREHFRAKAAAAISAFTARVEGESDSVLDDANASLAKLREEHAKGRTRTDHDIETAARMRREIEEISARTVRIAKQLSRLSEEALA